MALAKSKSATRTLKVKIYKPVINPMIYVWVQNVDQSNKSQTQKLQEKNLSNP